MMKRSMLLALGLMMIAQASAQVFCSEQDQQRLQRTMLHLSAQAEANRNDFPAMIVVAGQAMLGTPYVAKTLEVAPGEPLVVNLSGLDCTTFLENTVVMARLMRTGALTPDAYYAELEQLRYREGQRDGYPSRLHYFSEWILDNTAKGIIEPVSQDLGGEPWQRDIYFMSTHQDAYEHLNGDNVSGILAAEERLSETTFHYLPKARIAALEAGIQNGDLIAITTSVAGLDIAHVGIAVRIDGRIHLMHASSSLEKVVISDEPLADYLADNRSQTGVMVCRLVDPQRS